MTKLALHQSRAHRRQIRAHALATAGTVPLAAAQLSQCLCPGVLAPTPARPGMTPDASAPFHEAVTVLVRV